PIVPEFENAVGADGEVYLIFPNTMLFMQRSFMSLRTLLPRGTSETYEVNLFYISDDAAHGPYEAEREKLSTGAHLINNQDIPILTRLQTTRGSMAADDANFVPSWDHIPQLFQIRVAEGLIGA